ncbi:hypothetical protein BDFB_008610, partial [Asbolus verrucosus]
AALVGDPRKRILSGEYEQAWQKDIGSTAAVKAENLGKALIEIIQKAPSGTSWIVENSRPPKEIVLFS